MFEPYLHTIYCDDIRIEVGNKHSYMGVYQRQIFLPEFPTTVAKFCAITQAIFPVGGAPEKLTLEAYLDDELLQTHEVSAEFLNQIAMAAPSPDGTAQRIVLGAVFVFSPLTFGKPGKLRVRGRTESGEVLGPVLLIEQGPPPGSS